MSLVRTEGLRGYWELVTELGGDAHALLAAARLPPAALEDPENFVPYTAVKRLLEKTAHLLDCPDFGLRLSRRQDLRDSGNRRAGNRRGGAASIHGR